MTPEDLIAAFETLAEAPDGVTRLRELILQLAVQGKLEPQDPDDEPASVLLERIAGKKARLLKEGKIRKPKVLPPVSKDEVPFEIPAGWAWVPFAQTHINRDSERVPLSRGERSSRQGPYDYYGASGIIDHIDDYLFDSTLLLIGEDGANLILRSTPIAFLAHGKFWVNNHAHVLDSVEEESLKYLSIYVNATDLKPYVTGTAQPKLNQARMNAIPCAFPPLAEQHRIVARVDELMGLLDRLEAARNNREATRTAVRDSSLAALRDADTPDEVEVTWSRVSERMEDLITDPADVEPLRQTVLQLAIRGRLVPQNSNDEPASDLLERMAGEKARLIKEGKIRKPKVLPPIKDDEVPFRVAETWRWARFGEVFTELRYGTSQKCYPDARAGQPVLRIPNMDLGGGTVRLDDLKYGPLNDLERNKWRLSPGELLMIRSNGSTSLVGRAVVVPSEAESYAFAGYLMRIRLADSVCTKYIRVVLESTSTRRQIEGPIRTTSGVKNVNSNEVSKLIIPIAPAEEQHRIVAKVDELMDILDRLEERLAAKKAIHDAFAAAAIHHLNA